MNDDTLKLYKSMHGTCLGGEAALRLPTTHLAQADRLILPLDSGRRLRRIQRRKVLQFPLAVKPNEAALEAIEVAPRLAPNELLVLARLARQDPEGVAVALEVGELQGVDSLASEPPSSPPVVP